MTQPAVAPASDKSCARVNWKHVRSENAIRGVLGFPVTPFRQDLSWISDALARNVDEMARYPFCALVAAGGTGELYSLTPAEWKMWCG